MKEYMGVKGTGLGQEGGGFGTLSQLLIPPAYLDSPGDLGGEGQLAG